MSDLNLTLSFNALIDVFSTESINVISNKVTSKNLVEGYGYESGLLSSGTEDSSFYKEVTEGGSECTEDEVKGLGVIYRKAVVEYRCGERTEVVGVEEVRSCEYLFKVGVKELCGVEGFGGRKEERVWECEEI